VSFVTFVVKNPFPFDRGYATLHPPRLGGATSDPSSTRNPEEAKSG
jgi:hypothetical protein